MPALTTSFLRASAASARHPRAALITALLPVVQGKAGQRVSYVVIHEPTLLHGLQVAQPLWRALTSQACMSSRDWAGKAHLDLLKASHEVDRLRAELPDSGCEARHWQQGVLHAQPCRSNVLFRHLCSHKPSMSLQQLVEWAFLRVGVKRSARSIWSSLRNPAHMRIPLSGACVDPHIFHAQAGWPGGCPTLQLHEVLLSSCKTCAVLRASSPYKM